MFLFTGKIFTIVISPDEVKVFSNIKVHERETLSLNA